MLLGYLSFIYALPRPPPNPLANMKAPAIPKTTIPAIHANGKSPNRDSAPSAPVKFHVAASAVEVSTWSIMIGNVESKAIIMTIIAIPAVTVLEISTIHLTSFMCYMKKVILPLLLNLTWQKGEVAKLGKDPKINVLHIYHSQDAELYKATIREDKVYCKGDKVPQFTNRGVFTVKDTRGRKNKKYKMLIYLDGKAKTAKPTNGEQMKKDMIAENKAEAEQIGKNISDVLPSDLVTIPDNAELLFEPLTFKDRVTVVKREIAKQLGKFKPMETWQFVVIIVLLAASIALHFIV